MTKLTTFFFDLDGTLLPIDGKKFEELYFHGLSARFTDLYSPSDFIQLIWNATKAMVADTRPITNETAFMEALGSVVNGNLGEMQNRFTDFYATGFDKVREAVIENAEVHESIRLLKQKGYDLVIATNPMFPRLAIEKRIEWTGLDRSDFSYVTSFEDNHYCKPQPMFFQEILDTLKKTPQEVIMVGNDVEEDLVAGKLGIQTYLITNHNINRKNKEVVADHIGDYADFLKFVESLPDISTQ
ncbi:MAG: HAD family hydrolase [Erysipelotrichaceae bacterium]